MTTPKLLAQIVVPTGGWAFGYETAAGTTLTATVDAATYGSFLELAGNLQSYLQEDDEDFTVTVSSTGATGVHNASSAWVWRSDETDDDLEDTMGLSGSETVLGNSLIASSQHLYGWYSPVGCNYPLDKYEISVIETETDAGGLTQYASSNSHQYRELTFSLVSPEAMAEGGTEGGKNWTNVTLKDLWVYVRDKSFRFYADAGDGTVDSPGVEGTAYVTLRRMGRVFEPDQIDPDDWAYWEITLETKVTT